MSNYCDKLLNQLKQAVFLIPSVILTYYICELDMAYRLLVEGEKIETGDQVLDDDAETWVRMPFGKGETVGEIWVIGCEWNGRSFKPVRREI